MNLNTDNAKFVLNFNEAWDATDRKALKVILKSADEVRVGTGCLRLLAEGKTLAWVNPNHVDFPEGIASIRFSTHRSNRVAVAA